jgi:hypothetical protein
MANDDKPQGNDVGTGKESSRAETKAAVSDRPFDRWLQKQLHAMYDEIASEPLPPDLLELIESDALRKNKGEDTEPK